MLILSTIILLISNALTHIRELSILFSRSIMYFLFIMCFLITDNYNFTFLSEGISIYSGLFFVKPCLETFIFFVYLIAALIFLSINCYPNTSYPVLSLLGCILDLNLVHLYILLKKKTINLLLEKLEKDIIVLMIFIAIFIFSTIITLICSLFYIFTVMTSTYWIYSTILIPLTFLLNSYSSEKIRCADILESLFLFYFFSIATCLFMSGLYEDLTSIFEIFFAEIYGIVNFNIPYKLVLIWVIIRLFLEKAVYETMFLLIQLIFKYPLLIFVFLFFGNIFFYLVSCLYVTIYNINLLDFNNYYWVMSSTNHSEILDYLSKGGGFPGGGIPGGPTPPNIIFYTPDGNHEDWQLNTILYKVFTQGLESLPINLNSSNPLDGYRFLERVNEPSQASYIDPLSKYYLHYFQCLSIGKIKCAQLNLPCDNLFNLPIHMQSQFQTAENALQFLNIPLPGTNIIDNVITTQQKILTRDMLLDMLSINDINTTIVRDKRYWDLYFHYMVYASNNNLMVGLNPETFVQAIYNLEVNLANNIKPIRLTCFYEYSGASHFCGFARDILNFHEFFYGRFNEFCDNIWMHAFPKNANSDDIIYLEGVFHKEIDLLIESFYDKESNDLNFITNLNLHMLYDPLDYEYQNYQYENKVIHLHLQQNSEILKLVYKVNPSPWSHLSSNVEEPLSPAVPATEPLSPAVSAIEPLSPAVSAIEPLLPSRSPAVQNSSILSEVYRINNTFTLPVRSISSIRELPVNEDFSTLSESSTLKRSFTDDSSMEGSSDTKKRRLS